VKTNLSEPSAGPRRLGRIRMSQTLAGIFVAGVLLYLFVPVAVTLLFSFTISPRLSLPIEGVTLEWYGQAFSNPLFTDALVNSLILAAITSIVAGVIGTAFSFGLVQLRRRTRRVFLTVGLMPAVIPALVLGIALALWFRELGLAQGFGNACIGHILVGLPFVILTMNARLETFDFTVLDAARDLGASPWRTFRDITFPLIRPTVLGAALLAMALSLDEFVVTWFNIGNSQTLPVLIWGLLRRGIDPSINALASVVLLCLVGLVLLAHRLTRKIQ
jgi:spermidine/putrescine transport system permease protein